MGTAERESVRYAVVGLGHITQAAVLPAFEHAPQSELAAFVSSDADKLEELSQRYGVSRCLSYDEYDELLHSGDIDAVYIALPNHLHCDYAVRAAKAGIHVLCEKPMAVTDEECEQMVRAAEENDVRLMVAYRLHFERANMEAARLARSGEIGAVRFFESVFSQNVKPGDIRLNPLSQGGGSVYDLGVYCINAARYIFRQEPTEVDATSVFGTDARFDAADEMTCATLRFPDGRLASCTTSFGAHDVSSYRIIGTDGVLSMDPAYGYATELAYSLESELVQRNVTFAKRDQFAPQLRHFSECVQSGRRPEPDGYEGWADVRIVRAIYQSAKEGRRVAIEPVPQPGRPDVALTQDIPGVEKPEEVHASSPKMQ